MFWEVVAGILVIIALGAVSLPILDNLLSQKGPNEIVIRMYIQESGGYDPSVIKLKKGEPVRLVLIDMDVAHGFRCWDLGIDAGVVTAKKVIEFTPEQEGIYTFYCSVYCSPSHQDMIGTIIVED